MWLLAAPFLVELELEYLLVEVVEDRRRFRDRTLVEDRRRFRDRSLGTEFLLVGTLGTIGVTVGSLTGTFGTGTTGSLASTVGMGTGGSVAVTFGTDTRGSLASSFGTAFGIAVGLLEVFYPTSDVVG